MTCFQQDQDSQSSAQLKAASYSEYDLPNDHLINHTFEIDGLYLLEHLSVLLRAVFKVITTSPEDKDGHLLPTGQRYAHVSCHVLVLHGMVLKILTILKSTENTENTEKYQNNTKNTFKKQSKKGKVLKILENTENTEK